MVLMRWLDSSFLGLFRGLLFLIVPVRLGGMGMHVSCVVVCVSVVPCTDDETNGDKNSEVRPLGYGPATYGCKGRKESEGEERREGRN